MIQVFIKIFQPVIIASINHNVIWEMTYIELAGRIDHTYLKLDIERDKVLKLSEEVLKYGFRALVIPQYAIKWIDDNLRDKLRLCTVVSFPHGMTAPSLKINEAIHALNSGFDEVDIVSNVSLVKSGEYKEYEEEVMCIVKEVKSAFPDKVVKIIGEVTVLNPDELELVISAINSAKPDFFKTSTGYGPRGTSVEDVIHIKKLLDDEIGLKASGGIRSYEEALDMFSAGADIIGTSSAVKIVEECIAGGGSQNGSV